MAKKSLNPHAPAYRRQDLGRRAGQIWRTEGPVNFTNKAVKKLYRIITNTDQLPEQAFEIEAILKNSLFDLSKIDVLSQIQLEPVVSMIIPVFNGISYVPQCIQSFYQSPVSVRFEVIAIDNGSTDGTLQALRQLSRQLPHFHLVENARNLGFSQAINQGAALARGEFIAVCNSDIIVTPGWLDWLVAAMRADSRLAVVGPVTNYVGEGPQLDKEAATVTPETAGLYAQQVAGRSGVVSVPDRLVFFCVLVRKQYFDFLGGVSSVFGLGNYEDDDFCLRARLAGFTLAVVPGSFVYHFGSRTFKEQKIDHVEWMLNNEKIYYERVASFSTLPLISGLPHQQKRKNPLISVVVRTKDRPYPLARALNSLANQTFQDFEVVLVNDGDLSVDPLLKTFEDRFGFQYIDNHGSPGRSAALNAGLGAAQGQWITYLDDDDLVYPLHLEMLACQTADRPERILYTDANKALCWSDDLQRDLVVLERIRFAQMDFSLAKLLVDNWIPIMTFMHPAGLAREIGGYDESLGIFEDWDFLLRLAQRLPFQRIPRITCEYRLRFGTHLDDSTLLQRENALKYRAMIYDRYPAPSEDVEWLRGSTIAAMQQQMEDVRRIATLPVSELQRSFLTAARLGGFPLPEALRK